jgi:outer membrane lipoprotein carrier protein
MKSLRGGVATGLSLRGGAADALSLRGGAAAAAITQPKSLRGGVAAVAIWLLAISPLPLRGQDPAAIVRRASGIYRGLSSLQADFTQVVEDAGIGDTLRSSGRLYQTGSNTFAMRFSDPPEEAIVIDGRHVWIYTPSTTPGQVIRMRMETDPVYGANLLAKILDRPAERYRSNWLRADTVGGRRVDVVAIVPSTPDLNFSKAVLWLDSEAALPRRIELTESPGVRRILTLSHLRTNVPIDSSVFEFKPPKGVRIVDQ